MCVLIYLSIENIMDFISCAKSLFLTVSLTETILKKQMLNAVEFCPRTSINSSTYKDAVLLPSELTK